MAQDAGGQVAWEVTGVVEGQPVGQADLSAVGVAREEHVHVHVGGGGQPAWVVREHEPELAGFEIVTVEEDRSAVPGFCCDLVDADELDRRVGQGVDTRAQPVDVQVGSASDEVVRVVVAEDAELPESWAQSLGDITEDLGGAFPIVGPHLVIPGVEDQVQTHTGQLADQLVVPASSAVDMQIAEVGDPQALQLWGEALQREINGMDKPVG